MENRIIRMSYGFCFMFPGRLKILVARKKSESGSVQIKGFWEKTNNRIEVSREKIF